MKTEALNALLLWLEDNVNMGTEICFDSEGTVLSEHCLRELEAVLSLLKPLPIKQADKTAIKVKKSPGHDCVRCSLCEENDNFVVMLDGTVECANCGHTKGHLIRCEEACDEQSD